MASSYTALCGSRYYRETDWEASIEQGGMDLMRRLIDEPLRVQMDQANWNLSVPLTCEGSTRRAAYRKLRRTAKLSADFDRLVP